MMNLNLAKTLGTVALTGTIVVSTVAWNGGDILTGAKDKLSEMTNTIGIFKSNENAMKDKILSMKDEIADLKEQVANGQGNATELLAEITRLEGEVAKAEAEITKGNENIAKLEGELNKANEDATALQTQIDAINYEAPMSSEELEALTGTEVVDPGTPEGGGGDETPGVATGSNWNIVSHSTYENEYARMEYNSTTGEITVTNISPESVMQPIKLILRDANGTNISSLEIARNDVMTIGSNNADRLGTIQMRDGFDTVLVDVTVNR